MRWTGHVEYMGRGKVHKRFWWGNQREERPLEASGLDRRILLK
jgi:hypothetical protein